MKLFLTVCKIVVSNKRTCRVFTVGQIILKKVNMFERMEISESIYEGVVEHFY